jgi:hypothetical protein
MDEAKSEVVRNDEREQLNARFHSQNYARRWDGLKRYIVAAIYIGGLLWMLTPEHSWCLLVIVPVVAWWLGKPYRYVRVGFPDVAEEVVAMARQYQVDSELLAYLVLETALGSKTKVHARECKFKATQWVKMNRKVWTNIDILNQVARAVAICGRMTPFESAVLEDWGQEDVNNSMQNMFAWVSEGQLPGGRQMPIG